MKNNYQQHQILNQKLTTLTSFPLSCWYTANILRAFPPKCCCYGFKISAQIYNKTDMQGGYLTLKPYQKQLCYPQCSLIYSKHSRLENYHSKAVTYVNVKVIYKGTNPERQSLLQISMYPYNVFQQTVCTHFRSFLWNSLHESTNNRPKD